ncbi:WD repeat and coiled-coil-containing protein-like [Hyla sarda]|uniref:WD repeat and coiled-coil-containing protein-like n=1 Tax=Hyla sarda TaxID=327740 RepID=UPI0024C3A9FA|nr:WD repeat and coiled-coil-containing protein-like [Hyla sarda]
MDLGRAKLLRCGINVLHHALHTIHGLAWTDGKQVILTTVHLQKNEAEFGSSVVIGQFEHVHGLFWGPATDAPALLAVQHKKHVTIWQLYYNPLEKNRLVVSQTCEYGDLLPILPQGCTWHPKKEILAVLTKKDVSILYTVCNDNTNIKADITCCRIIQCACWTKDGSRVVVAMEDSLYSFIWNDDQKSLSPCSFCPIFNIDATIVAIQPIMDYQVVITSEISTKNPQSYIRDSEGSSLQSTLLMLDEELSRSSRRVSMDSGKSEPVDMLKVSPLMSSEMSQMLARHRKSDPSPLMHLKQRSITGENKPELSNLLLITFEKNSTTTRKVSIPGISSPDIIALDSRCERVAVASNTGNLVLIYPIAPSCMPNILQIRLEENEKAKGLCFLTDTLLLIMVGRPKSSDLGFVHILASEKYTLQLVTKNISPVEYIPSRINCGQNSVSDQSGLPMDGYKSYGDDHTVVKEFWMPNHIGNKSPRMRRKIRDLVQRANGGESPTSSLDDYDDNKLEECPITLENLNAEPTVRRPIKGMTKALCRSFSVRSNNEPQETKENHLSTISKNDSEETAFQIRHSGLKDSWKKYSQGLPYPSSDDPPYISISQQNSSNDGANEARAVLLCNGKLHLRTLQEVFHFNTIEMKFGAKWIVLTEDGEGFVPVIFRANQEVVIRDVTENTGTSEEANEQMEP